VAASLLDSRPRAERRYLAKLRAAADPLLAERCIEAGLRRRSVEKGGAA